MATILVVCCVLLLVCECGVLLTDFSSRTGGRRCFTGAASFATQDNKTKNSTINTPHHTIQTTTTRTNHHTNKPHQNKPPQWPDHHTNETHTTRNETNHTNKTNQQYGF